MAIGAPPFGDESTGSAYIFSHDAGSAGWVERLMLIPPDAAIDDQFGHSVAVGGDVVVVGAPGHDAAGIDAGAAYVFDLSSLH